MLKFISNFNIYIFVLFTVLYFYRNIYVFITLKSKGKKEEKVIPKTLHKYAVVIAARNEEAVLGELIQSIKSQKYPKELVDIFVIADNCTDNTAQIARDAGTIAY